MIQRFLLLTILLVASIPVVFAQKVKYKELFVLLNAKQYDEAEPFLKKYLKDNDDNPNADLFMGIIFQEKAAKNDVLKHTEILINNIDSAIYYYEIAYKGIDDREVRKNDEYYQAYNRRDLRTGKFGVKLSDIQFDLEKRMEGLKEKKERVRLTKEYFTGSESMYAKANFLYKDLQLRYKTLKALYLQSNDTTLTDLNRISSVFDSCMLLFDKYKSTSQLIGKTGHNQKIDLQEIHDFEREGQSLADFMTDDLKLWNYKLWVQQVTETIEKEVIPLREHLVTYDIQINKLRDKVKKDSVSVESELTKLIDQMFESQLKKFDDDPMPLDLFGMKIAELEYASRLVANKVIKDSLDVNLQLKRLKEELIALQKFDSLSGRLTTRELDQDAKNYRSFITDAYGTLSVLKSLAASSREYAKRELAAKKSAYDRWEGALRWIVAGQDSIPLFMEVSPDSKFKPLVVVENRFTAGLKFADTLATGYFYTIAPSHRADVAVTFPVDAGNFGIRMLPVTKGITSADENDQVFYVVIYSEQKNNDKFPATIAKIYRTDGLAWSKNFQLDMIPVEVSFKPDTGELSIKTSNPAGESKMVSVDKQGKLVQ